MGAQKHGNSCRILWADVTFQPGISDTDSQAVTYPGDTWCLHHPDLYFYWISSSVDGHCTPPSGLGQESEFCGPWRERTQLYVEETD